MNLKGLTIVVPKEISKGERRVAVIPETVRKFTDAGGEILIESGAGENAFYDDAAYSEAGAIILKDVTELFARADIILKVKEPLFNEKMQKHEVDFYPENSILVGFLHPANKKNHEILKRLAEKHITSFTLDGIPRISRAQHIDALTSMSTVAGYKAAIIAAYHLPFIIPMMPTSFGVLQPARFLIVGAGVAGLQAMATAKRLGAKIRVLDIRPEANEHARSLGAEVVPFDVPSELALGKGGYAKRLPEEWVIKEKEIIASQLHDTDVVILTALIQGQAAPVIVDSAMVHKMKKGSVIIDIAIDQGGNCELSRYGEEYDCNGVFISALKNIPASVSADSTFMFAHNAANFVDYIVTKGTIDENTRDEVISGTLVTTGGNIVHKGALLSMGKG